MGRTSSFGFLLLFLSTSFLFVSSASASEQIATSSNSLNERKRPRIDTSALLPQFPVTEEIPQASPELQQIATDLLAYSVNDLYKKLFNMGEVEAKKSLKPNCKWNILHEAVYTDNIPIAEVLIETLHFDPNEWDQTFGNAMYLVKSTQMTKKLIALGGNPWTNRSCELFSDAGSSSEVRHTPAFLVTRPENLETLREQYLQFLSSAQARLGRRSFTVEKGQMYDEFLNVIETMKTCRANSNLKIEYIGEQGLDYGGLTIDVITYLKNEMIRLGRVFEDDGSGLYNIKADAPITETKLAGFIFGLSIYHRTPLNIKFVPIIYHLPFVINPQRDLNFISILYETDTTKFTMFEKIRADFWKRGIKCDYPDSILNEPRDWKRKRSDVTECGADLVDVLKVTARDFLYTQRAQVYEAFLFGLGKAIDYRSMFKYLTPEVLQTMITGTQEYTAEEFRASTTFHNMAAFEVQYTWLLEVIDEFTRAQRAKFLKFVTALETLPIGGFKSMAKKPEVEMLAADDNSDLKLPLAATCFSTLKLYLYSSKEILKNKLSLAIEEGDSFGRA